jgi:hypothetical protein
VISAFTLHPLPSCAILEYEMPSGVYERTPETREKLRQARLGHKDSPETIEKRRQANLGKKRSPEFRERTRQGTLRQWATPEIREKMVAAIIESSLSPEWREKVRQARFRVLNMPPKPRGPNEYERIRRYGVRDYIHRLVWEQANGPIPEGHVIHHINGDRADNRPGNLAAMARPEHVKLHLRSPVG